MKLIEKLIFATLSVVALVFFTLGRREAAIVGAAVLLTLAATLFASWAWGFTLNRVSLFALIFSIGILVDDAIVVVENIHRRAQIEPADAIAEIIPRGGRRGRRTDDPRDADRDRRAAADGVRQRTDGSLHEPDSDQREHGNADLAGDRVHRHAVARAARCSRSRTRARTRSRLDARCIARFSRLHRAISRRATRRARAIAGSCLAGSLRAIVLSLGLASCKRSC